MLTITIEVLSWLLKCKTIPSDITSNQICFCKYCGLIKIYSIHNDNWRVESRNKQFENLS